MKRILTIIFFLLAGIGNRTVAQHQSFTVSTFKKVPDELMGCGDCYYLSEKDKKETSFVCVTDYTFALVYINNKAIRLKANDKISHDKNEEIYTSDQYILIVKKGKMKQLDSEYYQFKGAITIKSGSKVLYQQQIVGEGGC
jgi:hypothetical protein